MKLIIKVEYFETDREAFLSDIKITRDIILNNKNIEEPFQLSFANFERGYIMNMSVQEIPPLKKDSPYITSYMIDNSIICKVEYEIIL